MKIGVLARPDLSRAGHQIWCINNEIRNVILNYGAQLVVITPPVADYHASLKDIEWEMLRTTLNQCDGFILQGGDDYYSYDIKVAGHLYNSDIPVLGICLGMQMMGVLFDGMLERISASHLNHHQPKVEYVHMIKLYPDTKLHRIFKTDTIKVNSRHNECISQTKAHISATSTDNIIEAIEMPDKTFFLGVQWHPESMIEYDKMSNLLFDEFFHSVRRKYESKNINRSGEGDISW